MTPREARQAAAEHHYPTPAGKEGRWYAVLMWIEDGDPRHLNSGELERFPPLAALILATADKARAEERAAVVAMLRRMAERCLEVESPIPNGRLSDWMVTVAEDIEAGEHTKGGGHDELLAGRQG